jgi:histidinol phosphatase-like enzyme (inositol monophosphatase family)
MKTVAISFFSLSIAPMQEFRDFFHTLLDQSRETIRPYYSDTDLAVETKSDDTPVTLADRETERILREHINETFPSHGIIGEEFGTENPDAEFVWVLDPIDGTKSFVTGVPLFGTLIALLKDGQPILGAIDQPILSQRIIGDGQTTHFNGRPVKLRKPVSLQQATLLTTDPLVPSQLHNAAGWDKLSNSVRLYRTWGDCYGYLLLASGKADIMVDPIVEKWDLLSLIPIIRGAGGTITDWHGGDPVQGNSIVAAHPDLHPEILGLLS